MRAIDERGIGEYLYMVDQNAFLVEYMYMCIEMRIIIDVLIWRPLLCLRKSGYNRLD